MAVTTTTTTTTTTPCDGCNCPMTINLDPNGDDRHVLTSPRYPKKYSHNQDCKYTVITPAGRVTATITKFNLEWSRTCKTKDYLFIGQIVKYSKTYLCGNTVPSGTKFKSKNQQMTIKFHSNKSVTRAGFKLLLQAIG